MTDTEKLILIGFSAALALLWWEMRRMRDRMHKVEGAVGIWTQAMEMVKLLVQDLRDMIKELRK